MLRFWLKSLKIHQYHSKEQCIPRDDNEKCLLAVVMNKFISTLQAKNCVCQTALLWQGKINNFGWI